MADRRNSELHSGAAAFEDVDNFDVCHKRMRVMEILLTHMKRDFSDFLGSEHDTFAAELLKGRRDTQQKRCQERIAEAKRFYGDELQNGRQIAPRRRLQQ